MRYLTWTHHRLNRILAGVFLALLAGVLPAAAQLSNPEPDPLARIRDAAKDNVQACSATGETLCEQVAPKIIANAQGESPLAENVRALLKDVENQEPGGSRGAAAAAWAVAAFEKSGIPVHAEKYLGTLVGTSVERENVIAEIRGREKPDEWVLLGAHLDAAVPGSRTLDEACNAALIIEAARDIQLTGVHPRRSIRFVLFVGPSGTQEKEQRAAGSWAYLQGHRAELDRARAAILFTAAASRSSRYELNGRRDIESGVREAVKPAASLGDPAMAFDAPLETDSLDFLLEGIPTVTVAEDTGDAGNRSNQGNSLDKAGIEQLKRNAATAAVAIFGVAERAEPIGSRQSRAEIESLLKSTGLDAQMKAAGLWPLWESGQRGRTP